MGNHSRLVSCPFKKSDNCAAEKTARALRATEISQMQAWDNGQQA